MSDIARIKELFPKYARNHIISATEARTLKRLADEPEEKQVLRDLFSDEVKKRADSQADPNPRKRLPELRAPESFKTFLKPDPAWERPPERRRHRHVRDEHVEATAFLHEIVMTADALRDARAFDGQSAMHFDTSSRLLRAIERCGGAPTFTDLGRLLGMSRQAARGHALTAVKAGVVELFQAPDDRRAWQVVLTPAGRTSALTRVAADDKENEASWGALPDLADLQTLGERKPGAETLLEAQFGRRTEPLLVAQRYGLGHAYVLATGGTWRWQMQLPHEDQRLETFWRQLLQASLRHRSARCCKCCCW